MTTTGLENLTGDYTLDPAHTRLGFVARHAMITKVRGQFNEFEGHAHIDFTDPAAVQRGGHDRGGQHRHPQRAAGRAPAHQRLLRRPEPPGDHLPLDGRSTRWTTRRTGVTGDLTIRGVTKPVSIDFEFTGAAKDPFGNQRVGFEGSTIVNRKDWGMEWNAPLETGGVLVSEKVTIEVEVSAVQVVPEA